MLLQIFAVFFAKNLYLLQKNISSALTLVRALSPVRSQFWAHLTAFIRPIQSCAELPDQCNLSLPKQADIYATFIRLTCKETARPYATLCQLGQPHKTPYSCLLTINTHKTRSTSHIQSRSTSHIQSKVFAKILQRLQYRLQIKQVIVLFCILWQTAFCSASVLHYFWSCWTKLKSVRRYDSFPIGEGKELHWHTTLINGELFQLFLAGSSQSYLSSCDLDTRYRQQRGLVDAHSFGQTQLGSTADQNNRQLYGSNQ